jgi:hypothetical protein
MPKVHRWSISVLISILLTSLGLGASITYVATPSVWTSTTQDSFGLVWHTNQPLSLPLNPQNGGFWTRETVLTGTYEDCVLKYGCIPGKPFKLDLYVFGDGVKYTANGSTIN